MYYNVCWYIKAYFWGTNWGTSRFEPAQSSYLIDSNPFPSVIQPGKNQDFSMDFLTKHCTMSIFVGEGMSEMLEIGFLLVFPWFFHGFIGFSIFSIGFPMVSPWFSSFLWVFPWFLHGNPMAFRTSQKIIPQGSRWIISFGYTRDLGGICQKHDGKIHHFQWVNPLFRLGHLQ